MKIKKSLMVSALTLFCTVAIADPILQNQPEVRYEARLDALQSKPNALHGIEGLHQGRVPLNTISPNTLKTFVSVVDLVRREYVGDVNDEELFKNAMSGMLTKLDRNAEFLDAKAYENLQSFTAGNVAGIGIKVLWQGVDNHWVITEVAKNSPADKANITVGDYLHQIGETKLASTHNGNDVMQLLNGIAGTQIDVVVSHEGRSKRTVSLQRTQNMKTNIETLMYDGVAVIKLPVFQDNTREQILTALSRVNVPIRGIILDVRNNPGGVLESAGKVVSLFTKNQTIAKVSGRNGVERILTTEGSPLLKDIPLIVLQNRYSASASEVLASSLQVGKRALIVGETSYGKGSVQSVIPIGDNQAVKLTTAHYLTAQDGKIDGVGVVPDVAFNNKSGEGAIYFGEAVQDDWLRQTLLLANARKLATGISFDPVGGF